MRSVSNKGRTELTLLEKLRVAILSKRSHLVRGRYWCDMLLA